jgi:DNA primase
MIRGQEFHSIIQNIFIDVNGIYESEQLQVNCPRCQERDGLSHPDGKFNLEINTKKRLYRCWKCEEPKFSGSLGKLIRLYGTNVDYELYKSFAGVFHDYNNYDDIEQEYESVKLPDEMILFSQMDENDSDHFEAYNYLVNERKINKETILKYRLGFCLTGKYGRRIIIPSYDSNGDINYFVARSYDKILKKKKPYDNPKSNKDAIIFNEGMINWDSTIYIVEGVFEMLSLPSNAIPLLGKTISITLINKLKELKPNVIVILDLDAEKDSINLIHLLKTIYYDCEEKIKIVILPKGLYDENGKPIKDLDELRKNKGNDGVIKSLRTARDLITDDYFLNKLQKPYEYRPRRHYSNTGSNSQQY